MFAVVLALEAGGLGYVRAPATDPIADAVPYLPRLLQILALGPGFARSVAEKPDAKIDTRYPLIRNTCAL